MRFNHGDFIINISLQAQCNVFEGASGEVSLTAGGGLRQLPGLTETFENAALVRLFVAIFMFGLLSFDSVNFPLA